MTVLIRSTYPEVTLHDLWFLGDLTFSKALLNTIYVNLCRKLCLVPMGTQVNCAYSRVSQLWCPWNNYHCTFLRPIPLPEVFLFPLFSHFYSVPLSFASLRHLPKQTASSSESPFSPDNVVCFQSPRWNLLSSSETATLGFLLILQVLAKPANITFIVGDAFRLRWHLQQITFDKAKWRKIPRPRLFFFFLLFWSSCRGKQHRTQIILEIISVLSDVA